MDSQAVHEWVASFRLDWVGVAPLLGVTALAILVMGVEAFLPRWTRLPAFLAFFGLGAAAWFTYDSIEEGRPVFGGMLVYDDIGLPCFLIVLSIGMFVSLISPLTIRRRDTSGGEYYSLVVFAALGLSFLAISRELITLFINLEIGSLALYVLSLLERRVRRSSEAAIKYFLLGAFSSALIVMGIAFLYGATGQTNLDAIHNTLASDRGETPARATWAVIGLGLLVAGVSFKLTLVPFHLYAPDVYEGAPTPVTALIATASKVAGFAVLASVVLAVTPGGARDESAGLLVDSLGVKTRAVLWLLAAASMVVGNLLAVAQPNIKRMLAFSSVAHSGYMTLGLLAVAAGAQNAIDSLLLYLLAYSLMTLLAFGVASALGERGEAAIADYAGLARRSPFMALGMTLAMLSLTGIPPTIGFAGKFYVFRAAIDTGYTWLVIIGVLTSVWSAYYYLRVIVYMYMAEPGTEWEPAPVPFLNRFALTFCSLLILVLGVAPRLLGR